MSKSNTGNGHDFANLLLTSNYAEDPDRVYTERYAVDRYMVDYRHAIVKYWKARGAKIVRTNNNWFDDRFYVYRSGCEKYIDPVKWYEEEYRPGILITTEGWFGIKVVMFAVLILLVMVVLGKFV